MKTVTFILILLISSTTPVMASGAALQEREVVNREGVFQLLGSSCRAELKTASMGGYLQLFIKGDDGKTLVSADDITGLAWSDKVTLVWSASGVYGKPGIFAFHCNEGKIETLVGASSFSKAYKDGADHFQIHELSSDGVSFYWARSLQDVDFHVFPTKESRYRYLWKSGTIFSEQAGQ